MNPLHSIPETVSPANLPNPQRRLLTAAALSSAVATAWPLAATAQPAVENFKNGQDYLTLKRPAPTQAKPGQTEVVEFFWYNCPHCNEFEPMLEAWSRRLPKNVVLRRVPVAFRADFEAQQRLYYTLEAMNRVDDLHKKVFASIHKEKQPLSTPEQIAGWAAKQGLDVAAFNTFFNSFSVSSQIKTAAQLQEAYQLDGVPSLGIAGRYYTSAEQAQTLPRALQVADFLIGQSRKSV